MIKLKWQEETKQHKWLLCFLVAFCISVTVSVLLKGMVRNISVLCFAAGLALCSYISINYKRRMLAVILFGLGMGMAYFSIFMLAYYEPTVDKFGGSHKISVEVTSHSLGVNDYGVAEGQIFAIDNEKCRAKAVLLYFSDGTPEFVPGDKLEFMAEIEENKRPQNGIFISASQREDISIISDGKISIKSRFALTSNAIGKIISDRAGGDCGALLKALLCGDKNGFSPSFRNALNRSGTSHITAVSGMHISIIMAFIMLLFGKKIGVFVAIPAIFAFAVMTGFSYSVMRAVIMASMTILAFILKRENDAQTTLFTALALLLCINPFSIGSISLLLSFSSVFGIMTFSAMLTKMFTGKLPKNKTAAKVLRYALSCAATSIAALIFTMPVAMVFFSTVSLVSVFTNVIILWAVTIIMGIGIVAVAATVILPVVGDGIFYFLLNPITNAVVYVIKTASQFPFSAIYSSAIYLIVWVVLTVCIFIYFAYKKKINNALLAGLGVAFLICVAASMVENVNTEQISILDTNGAAAIVIKNGGQPVIVNCGAASGGRNAEKIQRKLFEWGSNSAKMIVLTNLNGGNIGGVDYLIKNEITDLIYAPKGERYATERRHFLYDNSGTILLKNSEIRLYKVKNGVYLPLIYTGKIRLLNTCGIEPLEAMVTAWENKLQADLIIIDDKMMKTPYAIEKICSISNPQMLICANNGYSYVSGVKKLFSGKIEDLKQISQIEIKHWVR